MKLNPIEVYNFLQEQGIEYLYHANTVTTACTFIHNGGLLSRGAVEHFGLNQTPQMSDNDDRTYNVWNDIFLDNIDLHTRFSKPNYYGPVLFKLSLELLKDPYLPEIYVTKNNPIYWKNDMELADKYFQNIDEFKNVYRLGSFREMFTLKETFNILPFENYLVEIILDFTNVSIEYNDSRGVLNLDDYASSALNNALHTSSYNYDHIKKSFRKCSNCSCQHKYLREVDIPNLERLFTLK